MRVAVLSDLHLASRGTPCAFRHDVDTFRRFVDEVAAQANRIVLAGDVFDTDLAPIPYAQRAELAAARRDWKPLLDHLDGHDVDWLYGNHDRLLAEEGVPESLTYHAGERRLLVLHGHQFYPAADLYEQVKYPVKWFAGRLEASGGLAARVGASLYAINDQLSTPSSGPSVTGRGALALLERRDDVHLIVCGHEHVPERFATAHGIYVNSGTCGFDRLDWVLVDLDRGTATIRSGKN